MAIIHVREVPQATYAEIKALAAENNRSISQQILAMLASSLEQERIVKRRKKVLARIDRRRAKMRPWQPGDATAVEMLREDRAC